MDNKLFVLVDPGPLVLFVPDLRVRGLLPGVLVLLEPGPVFLGLVGSDVSASCLVVPLVAPLAVPLVVPGRVVPARGVPRLVVLVFMRVSLVVSSSSSSSHSLTI